MLLGVTKYEGHNRDLPQSMSRGKERLFFVFRMQCHLPVSAFQVRCREPPSTSKRVQGVVDHRERKAIFCDVIQSSVVYAEAKAAIFRTSTTGCDHGLSDSSITPFHVFQ